jgi:hypothetical protein
MFGRTVDGKASTRGWNDQAPVEDRADIALEKSTACWRALTQDDALHGILWSLWLLACRFIIPVDQCTWDA